MGSSSSGRQDTEAAAVDETEPGAPRPALAGLPRAPAAVPAAAAPPPHRPRYAGEPATAALSDSADPQGAGAVLARLDVAVPGHQSAARAAQATADAADPVAGAAAPDHAGAAELAAAASAASTADAVADSSGAGARVSESTPTRARGPPPENVS